MLFDFLGSTPFSVFLTALDTDSGRVADREMHEKRKTELKEQLSVNGHKELHRWFDEEGDFEDEAYADHIYPKVPLPPVDWVHLREDLMPAVEDTDDALPALINDLGRYVHSLHFKLDAVLAMCRAKASGDGSLSRDWEDALTK